MIRPALHLVFGTLLFICLPIFVHGADEDAFTYQGHLAAGGEAFSGVADFEFLLFDGADGEANQVGSKVAVNDVSVTKGLFNQQLDFGAGLFTGEDRWLEIRVNAPGNGGGGPYTTLTPRQRLTSTPYAFHAGTVSQVGDSALSGTYSGELALTNPGNQFTGEFSGDGALLTNLNAANIGSGVIGNARTTGSSANVANTLVLRDGDGNISVATMNAGSLAVSGGVVAGSFSGSHSGNGSGLTNLNASSLTTGTIPSARLSGTYSNALTLSNFTNFFKGNGAGLSNLNAENIVIGTLAEERLPPSVLDRLPDSLVALSIKGSTSAFDGVFPQAVAMSNGLAYVTTTGGAGPVLVYDVNDPSGPSLLGGAAPHFSSIPPSVSGSRLYVGSSDQLKSFDISNPSNPTLVSGLLLGGVIRGVAATESHVFVINSNSALFRFSVTGSGLQAAGANSVIGGFPLAIAASGSTAYVISGSTMPVLEIFTASAPDVVGSIPIQLSPRSVAVSGDHVFVVNLGTPQRLDVFNVSNPASPSLVGSVGIASSVSSVAVSGNYAYVAHDVAAGTVRVYDVSDPSSPFLLDSISLGVRASSLAVSQGTVSVLSSDSNTLFALRTSEPLFAGKIVPTTALFVESGSTATLSPGSGFLQVGPTNGANLVMDGGRILARNNGQTGLMRINTTGVRVGSGTDPFGTLHVEATDGGIEGVGFRVRFDGNTRVRVTSNGGTSLGANADAPDNGLRVAGETYLLGNVGVATSAPGAFNLAVNGSAAKTGGGSWSTFSDERLKHDVQPLAAGVLDRVLSLNGYTFQYHDEAVEKKLALPGVQIGFIAQEVAEVFPDWVEADDEGYLFVTERGTTALFVESMRELRAEKDAEIAELRAEKEELARRLERLEGMMRVAGRQ